MKATFEVGKTYSMKSVCDQNCVWTYKVVSRTYQTVKLECQTQGYSRKPITCRVTTFNDAETCKPMGSYSMAPILRA